MSTAELVSLLTEVPRTRGRTPPLTWWQKFLQIRPWARNRTVDTDDIEGMIGEITRFCGVGLHDRCRDCGGWVVLLTWKSKCLCDCHEQGGKE